MTRRDDTVAIRHIRDHAVEATALARDRSRHDLDMDRLFALGLTKLIEIIGEAAGRVTTATRDAHTNIPWKQIVGTRNRLVHGYDEVDFDILWTIVKQDLPGVIRELEDVLGSIADNKSTDS